MSSSFPNLNPLGYQGLNQTRPPNLSFHNKAPTVYDIIGFNLGDEWLDESVTPSQWYKLVSKARNIATWLSFANDISAFGVQTLSTDNGTKVSPDISQNIKLAGTANQIHSAPGINEIQFSLDGSVPLAFSDGTNTASAINNVFTLAGNPFRGLFTQAGVGGMVINASLSTTSLPGVVQLATSAQAIAGSNTANAVTPSALAAKLGAQTQYGVILGGGSTSALSVVAPGTLGYALISNGAAAPSWQAATNLILISSQVASSSTSLVFSLNSTYNNYLIVYRDLAFSVGSAYLLLQLSVDAGGTFISTGYSSGMNWTAWNSTSMTNVNSSSGMVIALEIAAVQGGSIWLCNCEENSYPIVTGTMSSINAMSLIGGGYSSATVTCNAFQLVPSSGNFSGTISLYGLLE